MSLKSDYLVDLIFKKLKNYKSKEVFLEKEKLNKFISLLFKENWLQEYLIKTVIFKIMFKL